MSKLDSFDITTATYKTVREQPILADILLPKDLSSGPHPLIIRFHAGALVCRIPTPIPIYIPVVLTNPNFAGEW